MSMTTEQSVNRPLPWLRKCKEWHGIPTEIQTSGRKYLFVTLTESREHPGYWFYNCYECGMEDYNERPIIECTIAFALAHLGIDIDSVRWSKVKRPQSRPTPKRVPKPSQVYFIQAVSGGLIKIGYACLPHGRLGDIQTMSPVKLRIIATIDGGQDVERTLHARFKSHRSHGEWFHPSVEVLSFIESEATKWNAK